MKVLVIRHGKVKHTWKKSCSSAELDEECRLYDCAPIEDMARIEDCEPERVYISTLSRSFQSAKMLFGERDFVKTALIKEVPLRSSIDTEKRISMLFWYTTGRIQWLINSKRQPEGIRQTRQRAIRFVRMLISRNEDCAVVTHGFFMRTLIAVMKQYGFRPDRKSLYFKNGEIIILQRK